MAGHTSLSEVNNDAVEGGPLLLTPTTVRALKLKLRLCDLFGFVANL